MLSLDCRELSLNCQICYPGRPNPPIIVLFGGCQRSLPGVLKSEFEKNEWQMSNDLRTAKLLTLRRLTRRRFSPHRIEVPICATLKITDLIHSLQWCLMNCNHLLNSVLSLLVLCSFASAQDKPVIDWSQSQISKLPASEKATFLFDGKSLHGWKGQTEKYFTVKDGIIIARNDEKNAPKASTYLVTEKSYRNFRLIFEAKLVTSEMHSGIALWGKNVEKESDPFSYMGHLVMFPSAYGYYDLFRRNSIYKDDDGRAKKAGVQHDWNRMEILAIGNRIQHAINGQAVADWSDPKPELCEAGPIGLQLHSNKVAQELIDT